MSEIPRSIAAQGGEYSYHGQAAKEAFGPSVDIQDCEDFPAVIRASRADGPGGAGVIAVQSAMGTIDRSAAQLVRTRPSALPTIVGRVDLEVSLVLAAAAEMELEELNEPNWNHRVHIHGQKEAWEQCEDTVRELIGRAKFRGSSESTKAIREVVAMQEPDHLAIGPAHAVEPLGASQVGDTQLNPPGSVTRFYALQRDPHMTLLCSDDEKKKTATRTIVSLAHPEDRGEMDKVLDLFQMLDLVPADFINFAIGDKTRHRNDQRRAGGIFEIEAGRYDPQLLEFFARVDALKGNDGAEGPFSVKPLGSFKWYPGELMDLDDFSDRYNSQSGTAKSADMAAALS